MAGREDKALEILRELNVIGKNKPVDPAAFAYVYLGLGDNDQTFYWLQKMYEERSPEMLYLRAGPEWDPLRSDPRFAELMKDVGLPLVAD